MASDLGLSFPSRKVVLFHGTSRVNGEKILSDGFRVSSSNWGARSNQGLVFFSRSYAPWYCLGFVEDDAVDDVVALVKVEVDVDDLYPEDDFVMFSLGIPKYSQRDIDIVDFERIKSGWMRSLKYLGNVSAKPDKVKVLGVTFFSATDLISKFDPVITPVNYSIMGDYYCDLSNWIFDGKSIHDFPVFMESERDELIKLMREDKK